MTLKEKFELSGVTLKEVAAYSRGKGGTASVSSISGVIAGTYKSSRAELYTNVIEDFLDEKIKEKELLDEQESEERKAKDEQRARDTQWLSLTQGAIRDRVLKMNNSEDSFFELVSGVSGMGKTHLLTHLCEYESKTLYVKARASQSGSSFMSMLLKKIGERAYGNTDEKLERFCEALRDEQIRILMIDEADLFAKDKDLTFERKFELLREIYEYSKLNNLGLVVLCVGLPTLKKRIDKLGGYVQSRITYSPEMDLSKTELEKIGQIKGLSRETSEYLADGHNARLVEKTVANVALGYAEKTSANLLFGARR